MIIQNNSNMNKILITTTMIALAGVTAMAQQQPTVKTDTTVTVEYNSDKYRVETAPFKANWFIGVDGGAMPRLQVIHKQKR